MMAESNSESKYRLEKSLWTEADFDQMGWHDNKIHALAFMEEKQELLFDLDYIFQWVDPQEGENHFSFWIAPCTLVFQEVYPFQIKHNNEGFLNLDISILDISRKGPSTLERIFSGVSESGWEWKIECVHGEIVFGSSGYCQYVRGKPILVTGDQSLTIAQRGGYSFEKVELQGA